MHKIPIKVIKRKDERVSANVKSQSTYEPKPTDVYSEEKIERSLHRKMADTVSGWIAERRINNRIEENSALRRLFRTESFLNKTA